MVKIENALGKKIQITNSDIYSQLGEKKDPIIDSDYESIILSMSNLASPLSKALNADLEKTKLYIVLYALGCIDGGNIALNHFNSIVDPQHRITNYDIMLSNLKKIFPDIKQKFNNEQLAEIEQLFSNSSNPSEIFIVKITYLLKAVLERYQRDGKFSEEQATEFIFNEINNIITNYQTTGKLSISDELSAVINDLSTQKYELNANQIDKLSQIAQKLNSDSNKEYAIESLNNLKSEKKIMVG